MFNVRLKRFYDTEQVQIFSNVMRSKGDVKKEHLACNPETGEIYPHVRNTGEVCENPFNNGLTERLQTFGGPVAQDSLSKSCSRTIKSIYDIARSNKWEWFFTFTFNPKVVNRYDYVACSKKFSKWLNNMRKVCPDMIYVVVPEQHKDGAFHFHGLFSDVMNLDFVYSGKYDKKGRPIYNCGNYHFGWTTATRITDFRRASSYLCKYITKDLCSVTSGRKRYWSSRNAGRPEVLEYLVEDSELNLLYKAVEGGDCYVKKVHTAFSNVTYIDKPIYTTNTSGFLQAQVSDNK